MHLQNLREEELKSRIAQEYFPNFDCLKIIGNIDFCVSNCNHENKMIKDEENQSLFWAEAKRGAPDIIKSITQLIITIGKARSFDKYLPPAFIGAFDSEKIAFVPYNEIHDIFYINDFNWNVTPSNHDTKEFKTVYQIVKKALDNYSLIFLYGEDDVEIHDFVKENFIHGKSETSKIRIDKNNFLVIYNKWLSSVKPSILVNWENAKKVGIIDGDFYLADLISLDNFTLKDKLFVLLKDNYYELDRKMDDLGMFSSRTTSFNDKQKAHNQFWNKYERPPQEEYWDYIVERRDLLVPQDVRERKGSFFTPKMWVELSQKYLANYLGKDWQDEYYIWDCAAGTGNLLRGLTNKYNIWASTLDQQDVDVMHEQIESMNRNSVSGFGSNLLKEHVFQFDFLNDDFERLPKPLFDIISNPEKRKKLLVYINPPYAEAGVTKQRVGTGKNKEKVATDNSINLLYKEKIGNASNELFALFIARIYDNFPNSTLALFSKLKFIQGTNFDKFKEFFKAKYLGGFIVPSYSFDNVSGKFPIGFTIWDFKTIKKISKIRCDIYENDESRKGRKVFYGKPEKSINIWIKSFSDKKSTSIGMMNTGRNDFQNQNLVHIKFETNDKGHSVEINFKNLHVICIFFAVRHCIEATWINDRDQFLFPNDGWKDDTEFQNDCLAFTLFHSQNRISSKDGINNWIPFTEYEVNAREKFNSSFMTDFIKGKNVEAVYDGGQIIWSPSTPYGNSYNDIDHRNTPLNFSMEAKEVFNAGRELWKYYNSKAGIDVNSSLYDIREYFQGRNYKGKMNNNSTDEIYNQQIFDLRDKLKSLAKKIEPKVYEYEFLK